MTQRTPLWRTVLDDLLQRLESGEFDSRFPTDRELMETYGVSRHTVREAVRELQTSGKISRHPGRGSRVETTLYEQPLGTVYSLYESIEEAGMNQDSIVLALEMRHDQLAAAVLELPADADLFYLERIRLADGEPIAHDRTWLPGTITKSLLGIDFGHTALYSELKEHCHISPEGGRERIKPALPDPVHAGYLELAAGEPVLEIERRTTARGAPLEWRITSVRGDRYSFLAEWRASDTLVVPRLVAG
ncbi:MAG: GntR family transcriptional regulator [bacterium]|nr:GntR family transcriptional regulator [bacterium]